ncbi:MAG: hypothetical protein ACK56F_18160, partial [bacterium]
MDSAEEEENPIISPCKCSGSLKYIHLKCILYWINEKKEVYYQGTNVHSITWNLIKCELCNFNYPSNLFLLFSQTLN